jgi:hypothetical protein
MEKVQRHHGIVCVCAECGSVMRTIGQVAAGETPLVSHGICPACADRLYGDIFRAAGPAGAAGGAPGGILPAP